MGRRAVERGLLTEGQVAGLGQRELVNLIFLPGLSTAASVDPKEVVGLEKRRRRGMTPMSKRSSTVEAS